MPINMKHL